MKTVHRTSIASRCPHGGGDAYQAEFHVEGRLLAVEIIQAAIEEATREPVYQEVLTQMLANRLHCIVVTLGVHGRFQTECTAEPTEEDS